MKQNGIHWITTLNGILERSQESRTQSWVMKTPDASCGAYAFFWACALSLGAKNRRLPEIEKKIFRALHRRIKNSGIAPDGLFATFEKASLATEQAPSGNLALKAKWLTEQLRRNRPVVMCIERPFTIHPDFNYRFLDWHLVTACGCDKHSIYVIDPAPQPDCDVMPALPIRRIPLRRLLKPISTSKIYVRDPSHVGVKTQKKCFEGQTVWIAEKVTFRLWANDGWALAIRSDADMLES